MRQLRGSESGKAPGRRRTAPLRTGVGRARTYIHVARLVDTNILVYRFDGRFARKQTIATRLLRQGIENGDLRLPHQAIVEFVAVVTRPLNKGRPLLSIQEALREAEELLSQFDIVYPHDTVVRAALRGMAAYGLSWFDAHLWAYAETFGFRELISEDFQHNRLYGTVRVINPFI
jgi:predicted nucleic acid-binding protein